jgi:hypothetical protein
MFEYAHLEALSAVVREGSDLGRQLPREAGSVERRCRLRSMCTQS